MPPLPWWAALNTHRNEQVCEHAAPFQLVSHLRSEYSVSSLILADWVGELRLFLSNSWCGKSAFSEKWNSFSFNGKFVCRHQEMDVWRRAYLLVYSWVIAWVPYFRAPGNNGETEGDQQLLQLLLCSVRSWKMFLFQVAEGTAMAGPSSSWVDCGKVCAKTEGQRGCAEAAFLTETILLRTPVGARQEDRTTMYLRLGPGGHPIIIES